MVFALDRLGNKTKFWLDDFLKGKEIRRLGDLQRDVLHCGKIADSIQNPLDGPATANQFPSFARKTNLDAVLLLQPPQAYIDEDVYQATVSPKPNDASGLHRTIASTHRATRLVAIYQKSRSLNSATESAYYRLQKLGFPMC